MNSQTIANNELPLLIVELSPTHKKLLQGYFVNRPINRAFLFGSYARKTAIPNKSDLDILVELDHSKPIGMKFFTFQNELEALLKIKVDLISADGISSHVKPFIDKDKILIYEKAVDR